MQGDRLAGLASESHPECSEGYDSPQTEILRCAQDDRCCAQDERLGGQGTRSGRTGQEVNAYGAAPTMIPWDISMRNLNTR